MPKDRFTLYWQLGQEDKAFVALRKWLAQKTRYDLEMTDQVYRDSGLRAVLLWKLENDISELENDPGAYPIARYYALLGMYEEALYWLEKAYHLGQTTVMSYDCHFRDLHDNPRYQAILKGMGLGDYMSSLLE